MTVETVAIVIQTFATALTAIVAFLAWRTSINAAAIAAAVRTEGQERLAKDQRIDFAGRLDEVIDRILSNAANNIPWDNILTPLNGQAAQVSSDAPLILDWLNKSVAEFQDIQTAVVDPSAQLREEFVSRLASWVLTGKFDISVLAFCS